MAHVKGADMVTVWGQCFRSLKKGDAAFIDGKRGVVTTPPKKTNTPTVPVVEKAVPSEELGGTC